MDDAEDERDRRDTDQRAGSDRQQRQQQRRQRAVDGEQQHRDDRRTQHRESHRLVLDRRPRAHREHARTADDQPRRLDLGACYGVLGGGECPDDRLDRSFLAVRVGARGARLCDHQRALPVSGHPNAVFGRWMRGFVQLREHRERLSRRIANEQILAEQADGRGQQFDAVPYRRPKPRDTKSMGIDHRAQEVAVREYELLVPLARRGIAVCDAAKFAARA